VCVGAVVLRGDFVLLVRQAKGSPLEGQWSIPWGVVEEDETPEEAARRETYEEAGVTVEVEGLLGVQNVRWECAVALVFLCRHVSGEPKDDGGVETDGASYFTLADLDGLANVEPWCEWVVRRVLRGEYRLVPEEMSQPYAPLRAFF